MDLQEERHHLEHVWKKLCQRHQKETDHNLDALLANSSVPQRRRVGGGGMHTLDIVLQDLREDREERILEAADSCWGGLAGDADGQAEGLEQVVVKVRLAGVLKKHSSGSHLRFC